MIRTGTLTPIPNMRTGMNPRRCWYNEGTRVKTRMTVRADMTNTMVDRKQKVF